MPEHRRAQRAQAEEGDGQGASAPTTAGSRGPSRGRTSARTPGRRPWRRCRSRRTRPKCSARLQPPRTRRVLATPVSLFFSMVSSPPSSSRLRARRPRRQGFDRRSLLPEGQLLGGGGSGGALAQLGRMPGLFAEPAADLVEVVVATTGVGEQEIRTCDTREGHAADGPAERLAELQTRLPLPRIMGTPIPGRAHGRWSSGLGEGAGGRRPRRPLQAPCRSSRSQSLSGATSTIMMPFFFHDPDQQDDGDDADHVEGRGRPGRRNSSAPTPADGRVERMVRGWM